MPWKRSILEATHSVFLPGEEPGGLDMTEATAHTGTQHTQHTQAHTGTQTYTYTHTHTHTHIYTKILLSHKKE